MTMTPTELRVLADVLESDGWKRLADYLRQCAEQRPVAYKHTESDGGMTYFVADEAPCEKCVPLYTHPAPAAPQAAPMADSDADYWLRNRQSILDGIERAGFMLMSNASGFWLHPRGKTDAQAGPIDPHMIVAEDRFPDAQVEPKREDQPLRDLLAVIHCDGGHHTEAVGLDQSIKDAQAAVYVLKRELAMAKRDPVLIDLLKQAEKCLAAGVRVDQTAPDEPPISEWDYEADRLSAEIFAWMKVHGIGGSDD